MPSLLVEHLVTMLDAELRAAAPGHCLRIDHLRRGDAEEVCRALRVALEGVAAGAFILDPGARAAADSTSGDREDGVAVPPERAVELRNRKQLKLCIFVPAGLVDAVASSLGNSFAPFDLEAAFRRLASRLLGELPEEVRVAARRAIGIHRGRLEVQAERAAEYLGVLHTDPSLERAGLELWRLNLIPDAGGDKLVDRLAENRRCVHALLQPPRPQATAEERLDATGLRRGSVRDELSAYLGARRLRDATPWLRGLADAERAGRLTFEKWAFDAAAHTELEEIFLDPLLDDQGAVQAWTGLKQPHGPGTQPQAHVGPKSKLSLKWSATPKEPAGLKRWRVELIAAQGEADASDLGGAELPSVSTSLRVRKASLALDIDLASTSVRAVQARVVGLDEHGAELHGPDGTIVQGMSTEFWLSDERVDGPAVDEERPRLDAAPTLAMARLRAALDATTPELRLEPGQWSAGDAPVYSVRINAHRIVRIVLATVLRTLEERVISEPESGGRFVARVESGEQLHPITQVTPLGVQALGETEVGRILLHRRAEFLKALGRQGARTVLETVDWGTGDIAKRARAYAAAYREALATLPAASEEMNQALSLDTVLVQVEQSVGVDLALLIAPTHPLRVLWHAGYADLLRSWESALLAVPRTERSQLLQTDLLELVAPVNCPAFLRDGTGAPYLFAANVTPYWGLALPVTARDVARRVGDVAQVLGLEEQLPEVRDVAPQRVAGELRSYLDMHPYVRALRINVVHPGNGEMLAGVLRSFLASDTAEDSAEEGTAPPPRIDVIAHALPPLPPRLPALAALQRELYEGQARGRRQHLAPLFSVALRSMERLERVPGGEVHVSLALELLTPEWQVTDEADVEDSSSFYGLLMRLLPRPAPNGNEGWEHRVNIPARAPRERHGPYTNDLVDTHRSMLHAVAGADLAAGGAPAKVPAVLVHVPAATRQQVAALHQLSDWVISIDRFMGVELFDRPGSVSGNGNHPGAVATGGAMPVRTYLLDYSPEFLEGIGSRMIVTTAHRDEVLEILGRAMHELGFGVIEESVGKVLDHLKAVSGRLALRIVGDDAHAREAVGLGVVAAYLRAQGQLEDSILVPVDAHPELFAPSAKTRRPGASRARCDLISFRFQRNRVVATLIEVKARSSAAPSDELLQRMVDQMDATGDVLEDVFFRKTPTRLDQVLQRSRLATILNFYLRRATRYGLLGDAERSRELEAAIAKFEAAGAELRIERVGYVVNVAASPQPPVQLRDAEIRFLAAADLARVGLDAAEGVTPSAVPSGASSRSPLVANAG